MKRIASLSIPAQHQLKVALATLKMPDALVGVMGSMTKAQALEEAIKYAEDALATVQYKIVGKLRPYFLYRATADNQWQCYINVARHGEGASLEVGRGVGSTKELALTAAIKFAEDALDLVKRQVTKERV